MLTEADILRAARVMMHRHGHRAALRAAIRAIVLSRDGETQAAETWALVARRIQALHSPETRDRKRRSTKFVRR